LSPCRWTSCRRTSAAAGRTFRFGAESTSSSTSITAVVPLRSAAQAADRAACHSTGPVGAGYQAGTGCPGFTFRTARRSSICMGTDGGHLCRESMQKEQIWAPVRPSNHGSSHPAANSGHRQGHDLPGKPSVQDRRRASSIPRRLARVNGASIRCPSPDRPSLQYRDCSHCYEV
jgi:hypothetical protein